MDGSASNRRLRTAVILLLVAAGFAGVSALALAAINSMAKMTRGLRAQRGEPLRSSRWGSASINGVNANGCVKIDEYGDGYLLRLMPIFGGARNACVSASR